MKRAYEQDLQKVARWLEDDYPEITARAKREKAEIHWGDETGVQNDAYHARGFSIKGKAPVINLNAKKSRINMISSITNHGTVRVMLYREKMTSSVLIKFLSRLVRDCSRKIFLILDNLHVHHSKKVASWLHKNREKIEVFFLTPYASKYNPDEYLNGNLKEHIRKGIPARYQNDIMKKTRSFMKSIQKRPLHVNNIFQHPMIAYVVNSTV